MSAIYDNWERLVAAVLKKQQLLQLFHQHSRSPSVLSEASNFIFTSYLKPQLHTLVSDFTSFGSSSRSRRELPKLVLISDFSPCVDLNNVYLASVKFLGKSVYVIALDNEVRVVVKRLESVSVSQEEFKSRMDSVGNVRHRNVAALRAYYLSEDERLMLYDYYSNGSVYDLLHGQTGETQSHVDWETRLKVAISAARGIAEIHTQNGGKLVHGNIKSSNVLLNDHLYACVSDLGVTNMIETTFSPTAYCYAPEVKSTKDVSQASDVYSFGVLLLELLTRKSTVHVPGGPQAVDLVKLVKSVKSKERAAKVFDADMLKRPTVTEQMIKMLQIGMKCVRKKKRPKMSEVVKMLEKITLLNPISHASLEGKLVFIDDANPTFNLEGMFRATTVLLGKGTFGTCYKAILENGNTIMVKRLKGIVLTFKDFQHHMEVIGRMRQENVAELKAYYFSKDEKMLVYDYSNQDSLFALLHGETVTGRPHLDWETRLKIAIGAARGVDYIHRQDNGKLVHGNIKSSNIFLHRRKYSLVSDAGLAKLTCPIKTSRVLTQGYYAPEVKDTKNVSQASDVYSFGVVLLELLSGKSSQFTEDDGKAVSLVKWIESVASDEWAREVLDVEILRHEKEENLVQLLQIAMDCVSFEPEQRPRISEVMKMLEGISGIVSPSEQLENLLVALFPQ